MISFSMAFNYLKPMLLLLVCLFGTSFCSTEHKNKEPIIVSDSNWTQSLDGEWMLEFMAPWCPACRAFKDVWSEFAGWGYDLDVSVGVVDVTENPGLSGRFFITSLPTIYHVKNGEFRLYSGGRKTTDLLSLIDEKKWEKITPVAWYRDPNSIQMGIVGACFKSAMFIRGVYSTMTDVYGIPEWACFVLFGALTIITGLLLGLLLVLCCDSFFPAKYIPLPPERIAQAGHDVPKDDTDIIDDTEEAGPDGETDKSKKDESEKEIDEKIESKEEDDSQDENLELRKRLPHKEK